MTRTVAMPVWRHLLMAAGAALSLVAAFFAGWAISFVEWPSPEIGVPVLFAAALWPLALRGVAPAWKVVVLVGSVALAYKAAVASDCGVGTGGGGELCLCQATSVERKASCALPTLEVGPVGRTILVVRDGSIAPLSAEYCRDM